MEEATLSGFSTVNKDAHTFLLTFLVSIPNRVEINILPALHIKATLVGHQDFFLLLLDASFESCVIAGVRRVADYCCVPGQEMAV